jgi:succinate dehydrogenase / fumarate reductase membrane anchor subunit
VCRLMTDDSETQRGIAASAEVAAQPISPGRRKPVPRFEVWGWLYIRISGLVLLVLAVGHVLLMHVVDEGVDRVDFAFVRLRWSSTFWRIWDWTMLVLALSHGVIGLRNIVLDYVRRPGIRRAVTGLFWAIGLSMLVLGTIVVATFDPSRWPAAAP